MDLVWTVLSMTLPVFLVAGAGFGWARAGFDYPVEFVTRLSMTLSLPCLIFAALMQTELDPGDLAAVALAALAAHGGLAVAMWALVAATGLGRRTYLAPLIFGNTGNLGLPMALFAFGEAGLGFAVAIFAVSIVLSFTLGLWLVAGGGGPGRMAREPLVWATLAGTLVLWRGWQTPEPLTRTIELVGQMAIPMMLLTLGVAVARLTGERERGGSGPHPERSAGAPRPHPAEEDSRPRPSFGRTAMLSLVKALAASGIAWAVGRAFGLPPVAHGVLVLQIATPVAVTSYLLAEKYGADAEAVAGLVVVSTAVSVAGLPLLLAFVL